MPSAKRRLAASTKAEAAAAGQSYHRRPDGRRPSNYPLWDPSVGVWTNEAGDVQPNFNGTRDKIRVEQRKDQGKNKRTATAGPSDAAAGKRRMVAEDISMDSPDTSPAAIVRDMSRFLSSVVSSGRPASANFDLGGRGRVRAMTSDHVGLVGSRVTLSNDTWPGQHGTHGCRCQVVGYVDAMSFPESTTQEATTAPACILRASDDFFYEIRRVALHSPPLLFLQLVCLCVCVSVCLCVCACG